MAAMPSYQDWLTASWRDFCRRWGVMLTVAGVGGASTILGVFLPLLAAGLAAMFGAETWTCFGLGFSAALLLGLWLSTWTQAAVLRAALCEEGAGEILSRSWAMTLAFSWVLSLFLLAVGGGLFLLVLPGLILSVLFVFAPVYQMSGEAEGLRALELSWARVRPRFGEVSLRLCAAGLITAAPGWIPYVGWLIAPFWTPFGIVATARLAHDLRQSAPIENPPRLGTLTAALSLVCLLGLGAMGWGSWRSYRALHDAAVEGRLTASGLDAQTGNALIAVLSGKATQAQTQTALSFVVSKSSEVLHVGVPSFSLPPP